MMVLDPSLLGALTAVRDLQGPLMPRVLRRAASDEIAFVFTGARQALMGDAFAFIDALGLLRRNTVMLEDVFGSFYLFELVPLLPGFRMWLNRLEQLKAQIDPAARVVCIGTSMGAYAAMAFGYHLRAELVLAFAPPTRLDESIHWARTPVLEAMNLSPLHLDLRALLAHGNGVSRYQVYFGQDHPADVRHAHHVADCPGVSLHPVQTDQHLVIPAMLADGSLRAVMPERL